MRRYAGVYYDRETDSYRYPEGYALGKPYDYFWNEGNGADMTVYQDSLNPFYNNSTDLMAYYLRPPMPRMRISRSGAGRRNRLFRRPGLLR